jgi:peptide subunit release factor RF-3
VFKTKADPFAGRVNWFRVYQGTLRPDVQVMNTRTHHKERLGQVPAPLGPGDLGQVAKLKETRAGDWLAARDEPIGMPPIPLPSPVMAFAIAPKAKGDEEKLFTALKRLQEEDPTLDLHRDPQTGEEIVAGLSQIHVEVAVDRLRSRFGIEVDLRPPRVPYRETIRGSATAHGRHKKQTGGAASSATATSPSSRWTATTSSSWTRSRAASSPGASSRRWPGAVRTPSARGRSAASRCAASACGSSTGPRTRWTRPSTPSGPPGAWRCARRSSAPTRSCSSRS